MKSLPRTPCQNTATTITATMMAKAFQQNRSNPHHGNHKRGLAEMMAPPSTPTATPNSSSASSCYLDCQSLQSSLKRVRLSSSPGELRLQRDLRHMVSSGSWVPKLPQQQQQTSTVTTTPPLLPCTLPSSAGACTTNSSSSSSHTNTNNGDVWMWHPPAPPVTVLSPHRRQKKESSPPPHIELQQVESLRLRLTYQHNAVAWIQIPRMYPHRPPLISRIVYSHNTTTTTNGTPNHYCNTNQGIQSILVHEAPPYSNGDDSAGDGEEDSFNNFDSNNKNNKGTTTSGNKIQCANTVVYHNWSPVQRLGDLLDFVITVFQKQEKEMNSGGNNNHNSHNNHNHNTINDVSLTYSSSSLSSNSSWNNHRNNNNNNASRRSSNSSITSASTTATTSGYRSSCSTSSGVMFPGWIHPPQQNHSYQQSNNSNHMMMNTTTNTTADDNSSIASSFLAPNRFDVGYDRAANNTVNHNSVPIPPTTSTNSGMMDVDNHNTNTMMTMNNGVDVGFGIPQQVSMMDL